tara:strand:+ start:2526 stop:3713 length:1188 start_codon:yes stop_codon:yes gene_type:complete
MAINIGAFLGGMAGAGSQILDERRAQKQKDLDTKEAQQWEIAREGRQNAEYRKRLRETNIKETDQFTSQLASFNFTPANITAIAAGGAENVKTWVDIALQHKKSGKDFDINLLVNNKVATDVGTIAEATNDVADANQITPTSNQLFASIYEEVAPEFKDLNNAYGYYQNKANNTTGKIQEGYQKQADDALNSLKDKADKLQNDTGEKSSPFSKPNIVAMSKDNRETALIAARIGYNRAEERFIRKNGDEGRYNIGILNGLTIDEATNKSSDGGVHSNMWQSSTAAKRDAAFRGLKNHAALQLTTYLNDPDAGGMLLTAEDLYENVADAKRNDGFFTTDEVEQLFSRNLLRLGSVYRYIASNGKQVIAVYTGDIGNMVEDVDGQLQSNPVYEYYTN